MSTSWPILAPVRNADNSVSHYVTNHDGHRYTVRRTGRFCWEVEAFDAGGPIRMKEVVRLVDARIMIRNRELLPKEAR